MSDKLTPEELQQYRDHMNNYAVEALLDHIAAVTAERDELAAALTATQRELELTREGMATHDATLPTVMVQRDMLAALVREVVELTETSGINVQWLHNAARRALAALDVAEDGT